HPSVATPLIKLAALYREDGHVAHAIRFSVGAADTSEYSLGHTPVSGCRCEQPRLLEPIWCQPGCIFSRHTQPAPYCTPPSALPTDAALIEFSTYRSYDAITKKDGPLHYVAYALASQGQPRWIELGETAPIDRAVDAWRKALRNPKRTDVKQLARAVDAKVMQ